MLVKFQNPEELHRCQKDNQSKKHAFNVCPQRNKVEAHSSVWILLHFLYQFPGVLGFEEEDHNGCNCEADESQFYDIPNVFKVFPSKLS